MRSLRPQADRNQTRDDAYVMSLASAAVAARDRRAYRRHDLEQQGIAVERWDGRGEPAAFGQIVDISAGGVRIRTKQRGLRVDSQLRVRIELPRYAGISPFVDTVGQQPQPKQEWVGWMAICRVIESADGVEIAAQLLDMEELDRGMLGLYLSTQPLAA